MKTVAAMMLAVGSVSALPALNNTVFAFRNGSLASAASENATTLTRSVAVTTIVEATQTIYTTVIVAPPSGQEVGSGAIAPAPTVTLTPAIHWDVVIGHEQLVPATAPYALYYDDGGAQADPDIAHQFGIASVEYTVPTVNLDHTGCIKSVSHGEGKLVIVFNDEKCFAAAQKAWSSGREILIMTFSSICDRHDNGDFCYFSSTSLFFSNGDFSVTLGGRITLPDDYIHAGTFAWGDYLPPLAEPTYYTGGSGDETPTATAVASSTGLPSGGIDAGISGFYGPQATKPACDIFDSRYGLQVGPIGQDFDGYLDDCLGYYDSIDSTSFASYVKDVTDNNELDPGDVLEGTSEDLDNVLDFTYSEGYSRRVKRSFHSKRESSFFEGVVRFNKLIGIQPPPIDKRFIQQGAFSLPNAQKDLVESPWGSAMLIKKFEPKDKKSDKAKAAKAKSPKSSSSSFEPSLSIYCVDCKVTGGMKIQGTVTIGDGKILAGSLDADASIAAQILIGIQAEVEYKTEYEKGIGSVGLPGLSYGLLTIGPMITLRVEGEVGVKAEGTLLVGGKFSIPNARVHIDFADAKKSTSAGWTPEFSKVFNTSGKIEVSAGIGFPIGLACGLNIGNGRYKADVGIVTKPGIIASAELSFESSLAEGFAINTDNATCKGISAVLNFNNTLYAEVNVFSLAKWKYQIMKPYVKELAKTCIAFGRNMSTATTATASSSSVSARKRALALDPRQVNQTEIETETNLVFDDNEISDVTDSTIKDDNVAPQGYTAESVAFTNFNTTGKGADFVALVDNTESIIITSCADKNVYIQPASYNVSLSEVGCAVSWQDVEGSVVADGNGRVLHYYINTMSVLNVSRLRISDEEDIPKQSEYVSLYSYGSDGALDKDTFDDAENSQNFYYAVDQNDKIFYPVVCAYKDTTAISKLFLVANLDDGVALLESAGLEPIVTGAPVSKCSFMPMHQALHNYDDEAKF